MAGIDLITRDEWGARAPRDRQPMPNSRGVKLHYTGSPEPLAALEPGGHTWCGRRMRAIQNGHMDERGWNDFAYNLAVCVHGQVFEGRGWNTLPAANGPGLNRGHHAVLALVGNAGLVVPTPAMYDGLCAAIGYLRQRGAGPQVLGHRDGYATDCPGEPLYAWVRQGAPCTIADHDDNDEGGDVPEHVKVKLGQAQPLPADQWTAVNWREESHDPRHQHADAGGPSVLNGPALYGLTAHVRLADIPAGSRYQVRAAEVDADGKDVPARGPVLEGVAEPGGADILYSLGAGRIGEGRRLRVQVRPIGTGATAVAGSAELNFWR